MGKISVAVEQFFADEDWKYEKIEGHTGVYRTGLSCDNASFSALLVADEDRKQLSIYAMLGPNIPEKKRLIVADYINRINYGKTIGNFEMDMADGEVRYRIASDFEFCEITKEFVKQSTFVSFLMLDRYYSGFMAICHADMSAKDAIDKIENKTKSNEKND